MVEEEGGRGRRWIIISIVVKRSSKISCSRSGHLIVVSKVNRIIIDVSSIVVVVGCGILL